MGAGRPRRYKTVEEVQEKIDEYFKNCEGHPFLDDNGDPVLDKYGEPVIVGTHPPTVTGLALALDLSGRQALLNYEGYTDKPRIVDAIVRAKRRCEEYAEARLFDRDGANGAKFTLANNFGWSDRKDVQLSGPDGGPVELSDDAARKSLEALGYRPIPKSGKPKMQECKKHDA